MAAFVADDWVVREALTHSPARRRSPRPRASGSEQDFVRADTLITHVKSVLKLQFDALRRGGTLDLPAMKRVTRSVAHSMARNSYAVIGLTRLRSSHEYTYVHSLGVSALMVGVARELRLPPDELDPIGLAGMLHDIGKTKVPVAVLDKPGALSEVEWITVKAHPERGTAILSALPGVHPIVIDVALHHHERLDGSGYPHNLVGGEISIHARIAAVCDVFDALTSRRAYKDGRPAAGVLDMMASMVGQFDPQVLRALRSLIGAFPTGTIVRLQRGQIAVVVDEMASDPLSPRVVTLYNAEMRCMLSPEVCDTRTNPIVGVERASDWPQFGL